MNTKALKPGHGIPLPSSLHMVGMGFALVIGLVVLAPVGLWLQIQYFRQARAARKALALKNPSPKQAMD